MICSNCLEDREDVQFLLAEIKYAFCGKCSVTYAKDRKGNTFVIDEEIMFRLDYHPKTKDRVFVIKGIYIFEESESGRLIHLHDKETGRPMKMVFDTNWLLKL
jgi:hypothetical protein